MSRRDLTVLKDNGISQDDFATELKMTRQTINKGLNRAKDYLTFGRAVQLLAHLISSGHPGASGLERWIKEQYPENGFILQGGKSYHTGHVDIDCTEMWIFSSNPFECQDRNYLNLMAETIFSHSDRTIVYFTTHDTAKKLTSLLTHQIASMMELQNLESCANLYVIECPAVELAPHFAIIDPASSSPLATVLVEDDLDGEFRILPPEYIDTIITSVRTAGFSIAKSGFLPPGTVIGSKVLSSSEIPFTIVFSSEALVFSMKDDTHA